MLLAAKSTRRTRYCIITVLLVYGAIQRVENRSHFVERGVLNSDKTDVFGFVSNWDQCGKDGGYHYQGTSPNVKCQCSNNKSTFLFSITTCINNGATKDLLFNISECSNLIRFKDQYTGSPYRTFDLHINGTVDFIQNVVDQVTKVQGNCSIGTHYIDDFTGKVEQADTDNVFSINREKKLKWEGLTNKSKIHGRVIGLTPTGCTFLKGQSTISKPCLIFKAKGTITFSSTSPTPTLSFHSSTNAVPTTTSTTRISKPTTTRTQSGMISPTSTLHGSSATSSAVAPTYIPTDSGHRNDQSSESPSPSTGAIVGAIFAVLVVIAIIVLVIIWRRHKHKTNEEKVKDVNKDNPAYGRGETINLSNPQNNLTNKENSDFEYDYAAVDGDPRASNGQPPGIYQSLTHDGNRESVYTPLDRQQDNPLEESTGYDKIDHTVFQPGRKGPTDPQYNVLQRPNKNKPNQEYLEPGVHIDRNKISSPRQAPQSNEPVYNVLEDPSPGGIADEPEYNVLEDPNGQHDPKYNVLEDPEGQYEPEYNVLEAPDSNHDKGPAKGHPSSHDNVGYASTIALKPRGGSPVYAAPESPISEPTYQPLTINAPDDSVYQPLDRRSRNVPDDQPVYHVLESATSTDA